MTSSRDARGAKSSISKEDALNHKHGRKAGRVSISGKIRHLSSNHQPPLASPVLGPNPVFEINPRGVGLRASPCRRVDSGEPNAPGDVSLSSDLSDSCQRGGWSLASQQEPKQMSRKDAHAFAASLAATLMVSIVVFQAGDGTFGAVPADEIDGDEVVIVSEYDPFA